MASVEFRSVRKQFGETAVLHGIDLTLEHSHFTVIVGPSGCGKSTLLRLIAGLDDPTSGEILIDGRVVTELAPGSRDVAMVFQNYALYPHMTAAENMAFGLENNRVSRDEIRRRVSAAAEILRIEPLLGRRPRQMSGGQRQRVAIGRAIVREPKVFLFDEPLSNLDAELRVGTRVELAKLHRRLGATMIFVTHDQVEAMTLADRIVVLNAGRVEQAGQPLELYHQPRNTFVAGFIGSPKINLFPGAVRAVDAQRVLVQLASGGELAASVETDGLEPGAPAVLGVRPEALRPTGGEGVPARIEVVERLGDETIVYAALPGGEMIVFEDEGASRAKAGDLVHLGAVAEQCHLFREDGTALRRSGQALAGALGG